MTTRQDLFNEAHAISECIQPHGNVGSQEYALRMKIASLLTDKEVFDRLCEYLVHAIPWTLEHCSNPDKLRRALKDSIETEEHERLGDGEA